MQTPETLGILGVSGLLPWQNRFSIGGIRDRRVECYLGVYEWL